MWERDVEGGRGDRGKALRSRLGYMGVPSPRSPRPPSEGLQSVRPGSRLLPLPLPNPSLCPGVLRRDLICREVEGCYICLSSLGEYQEILSPFFQEGGLEVVLSGIELWPDAVRVRLAALECMARLLAHKKVSVVLWARGMEGWESGGVDRGLTRLSVSVCLCSGWMADSSICLCAYVSLCVCVSLCLTCLFVCVYVVVCLQVSMAFVQADGVKKILQLSNDKEVRPHRKDKTYIYIFITYIYIYHPHSPLGIMPSPSPLELV